MENPKEAFLQALKGYFSKNFVYVKNANPKEITDPIVKAVEGNKKVSITNPEDIYKPLQKDGQAIGQALTGIFERITELKGDKGDTGAKGEKGEAGKDGRDGKDGKDGKNGLNGKDGINGKNGTPGKAGKDGLDGKTPVLGQDYFTEFDKNEIVREATPKKGKDYATKTEKASLIDEVKRQVKKELPDLSQRQNVLWQREPRVELQDLRDVQLSSLTNGQAVIWDSTLNRWKNGTVSGGAALTVKEIDGSPSVASVSTIRFSNGTVTDDGGGQVTVTTSGGATGIVRSVSSISADTTAGATASTDYDYYVSGLTTLTLPTAVGNTNQYTVTRTGSSNVTIATTSAQTIAGLAGGPATSVVLTVQYAALIIKSNGANWFIS